LDLKKTEKEDWWSEISIAEQNSINKGIEDAEKGRLNANSDAKKIYGKWL
jgi:predicted transcriptional regulator